MLIARIKSFLKYLMSFFTSFAVASIVVHRSHYFHDVIGLEEVHFQALYTPNSSAALRKFIELQQVDQQPCFILKNQATHKTHQAGFFKEYSIKDLRNLCQHKTKTHNGSFHVIEGRNTAHADYRKYVDIGALQANPANRNAVFQVASNFSCLEPVSMTDYPESGITKYTSDHTQGPFAAISAAPGLLYRMYFIFYNPHTNPLLWRQTTHHQINLLEATNIPTRNGYVMFDKTYLNQANTIAYEEIKIGYHADIQVTYGYLNDLNHHTVVDDPAQIINQVFTAAVDFGATNYCWKNNHTALEIAEQILDAAYEGTILSAVAHGKKKVFLTLIGGGVFQNKLSAIASALEKVQTIIYEYGLNVTLIIYDSTSSSIQDQMTEFRTRMQKITKETHGTYITYGS
jgi:hypothetical protein